MPLYCHSCGTGLPVSARFCSSCGATIPMPSFAPGRPLFRPRAGRTVAGVCAGLARAYGWDVALVRIFCVLGFFFTSGLVAVAYLACWIGIPEESWGLPGEYPPSI